MKPLLLKRIVLALALVSAQAGAQVLDLPQAYREALANDSQVASARLQLAAVREKVPQAQAGLGPTVTGAATISQQAVDTSISRLRNFTTQSYSVSMSWPLYRLQNVQVLEQSKLQVAVAEAQLSQAQQDLAVRVGQAYFDVLAAQDSLATIRAQKRAISEQLASAKRNFEVGTATITDQQEAQSRFDLAVAQEFVASNDLAVRRAALSQLVGKPISGLQVLRKGISLSPPSPSSETDWTQTARQDSLLVQQAKGTVEIARREVERQRVANRPTVDAVSTVGFNRSPLVSSIGIQTQSGSVGVQLSIPLYTGGAIESRVREALQLRDKSESDLETVRRQVEQSARQAFLGINSGLAQIRALEAAEKSSQLALASNLLGYQVGVRINIDVLNAQQQLFNTQRDLAKARYDVLVNGLRLKLTGAQLSEAELQSLAALMQTPDNDPTEPAPAASPQAAPGGGVQVTPLPVRSGGR